VNEELVREWVAALRSGDYKQGRAYLRIGVFYCCLGVAADLLRKRGLVGPWEKPRLRTNLRIDGLDYALTPEAAALLGLDDARQVQLQQMNDGAGVRASRSFPEIADWIEENILKGAAA
jgi:hypothetical protein